MISKTTTAIDLIVNEISSFIDPYRKKYSYSKYGWMPPHITLLFPFKHPDDLTKEIIENLKSHFSNIEPFYYKFYKVNYFPEVAYLSPSPDKAFIDIMKGVMRLFPDCKPYGKKCINPPPPHLTFAKSGDPKKLKEIGDNFYIENKEKLDRVLKFSKIQLTLVENGQSSFICEIPLKKKGNGRLASPV